MQLFDHIILNESVVSQQVLYAGEGNCATQKRRKQPSFFKGLFSALAKKY
jgi:hypothetical protein